MTQTTLPPLPDFSKEGPAIGAVRYLHDCAQQGVSITPQQMAPFSFTEDRQAQYKSAAQATRHMPEPSILDRFQVSSGDEFYDPDYLDELDHLASTPTRHTAWIRIIHTVLATLRSFSSIPFKRMKPAPATSLSTPTQKQKSLFPNLAKPKNKVARPQPAHSISVQADATTRLKVQSKLQQKDDANGRSRRV